MRASPSSPSRLGRAVLGSLALLAIGCRQDMHNQPKYRPLQASTFFDDGRASRPVVGGTVARGQLRDDVLLYTGMIDGADSRVFPIAVDERIMTRGRERFDIFCSPCHDRAGTGNGVVVRRGFQRPPSLHESRLSDASPGRLFNVITNGIGAMPSYSQIAATDRWAVVAYIKALQLSERATLDDVPRAERERLEQER